MVVTTLLEKGHGALPYRQRVSPGWRDPLPDEHTTHIPHTERNWERQTERITVAVAVDDEPLEMRRDGIYPEIQKNIYTGFIWFSIDSQSLTDVFIFLCIKK